jgi:hypothetical protein
MRIVFLSDAHSLREFRRSFEELECFGWRANIDISVHSSDAATWARQLTVSACLHLDDLFW